MKEALFYQNLDEKLIKCGLCHHFCLIGSGKRGICGVRENRNGKLFSLVYGRVVAECVDPIEKKPLYHFLPKTDTFSIATVGCNFKCTFCQNADISQFPNLKSGNNSDEIIGREMSSGEVVLRAKKFHCPSVSYTYTEPTIFYEFALDCMKEARDNGLKNIWVSNGYTSNPALKKAKPYLDAVNIDLKFWKNEDYLQVCGARIQPILDNLVWYKQNNIWLEVTTLIVPGLNDNKEDLEGIAGFIKNELGFNTPWHISAFFPTYQMHNVNPTTQEAINLALKIGFSAGLKYVYSGNI